MGSRMIREQSNNGGWWLIVALFTICVVGWSLAFSFKAEAGARTEAAESASRYWTVADFDRVSISGSHEVTLVQGALERVSGDGDAKDLNELDVFVESGELIVRNKRHSWFGGMKREPVALVIELKTLKRLSISGAADIRADALSSPKLFVRVSGSSDIEIEQLASDELEFSISGSADVEIGGEVASQRVRISGSADYEAENLSSTSAVVDVRGSGDARLAVSTTLEATVSGSGSIRYSGEPEVQSSVSGSGDVRPL